MRQFHPLKIAEITRETEDAVSIRFTVPQDLKDVYRYTQGQHIVLKTHVNGEELRRNYSICASVRDDSLRVAVKRVRDGRFSTFANEGLKAGDVIDVFPPGGRFYRDVEKDAAHTYVAFAGGSGITPVLSIIKTVLEEERHSRFTLFYGNRNAASIIFLEELSALKNRYMDRFEVFHFLEEEEDEIGLFNGRLDGDKIKALLDSVIDAPNTDAFFICGPGPMMDAAEAALHEAGVTKDKILIERFLTSTAPAPKLDARTLKAHEDAAHKAQITLTLGGAKRQFAYDPAAGSLLEAARAQGVDAPFACKGGVCCTCRAKIVEGEVDMAVNYGLTEEEVAQGFVLTCQSVPVSDRVTLDYDA